MICGFGQLITHLKHGADHAPAYAVPPKAVAEPNKVLFVHGFEHSCYRLLDNLVLQRRNTQLAHTAIFFGNVSTFTDLYSKNEYCLPNIKLTINPAFLNWLRSR